MVSPDSQSDSPFATLPHAGRLGHSGVASTNRTHETGDAHSRELVDAVDAFTREQRVTNEILREVAYALGTRSLQDRPTVSSQLSGVAKKAKQSTRKDPVRQPPSGLQGLLTSDEVLVGLPLGGTADIQAKPPSNLDNGVEGTIKEPFITVDPDDTVADALRTKSQTLAAATAKALEGAGGEVWTTLRSMVSWTHGWQHAGQQVTSYDFDALQEWAAVPLILCSCSVFRLKRALGMQLVLQVLLILGLTFFIKIGALSEDRLSAMRDDASPILEIALNLGRLVPFLLGLFVSLCLKRWWTMRSSYVQKILSSSAELSFWLRVTLPESASWVRERVERDCLLGHKLLYLVAQGQQEDLDPTRLRDMGLLTPAECERIHANTGPHHLAKVGATVSEHATSLPEAFFDFNLAALPFCWAAHLVYRVFQFGNRTKGEHGVSIPAPIVLKMLMFCMQARQAVEGVEMMLSQPLPFPYVHLVCILVHFSALFSCVRAGIVMGTNPTLSAPQVVFESAAVLTVNSLYCGLLSLCAVLADPFGNDSIDFPGAILHHRLAKAQLFASQLLEPDAEMDAELHARLFNAAAVKRREDDDDAEDDDDDDDDDGGDGDAD